MGDQFNVGPPPTAASLGRGLSSDMWLLCPRSQIRDNPELGFGCLDRFLGGAVGPLLTGENGAGYTVDNATSGTAVLQDAKGGTVLLDSGATTADQGVQIQRLVDTAGGECWIPNAAANIYFECRVTLAAVGGLTSGNGAQLFFGLHERDATIFATGALSGSNYIGFTYDAADTSGVFNFTGEKATVQDKNATGVAIAADSFKLGFIIEGVTKARAFINGVEQKSAQLPTAAIPIVLMAPSVAVLSEGTVQPTCAIDWIACYQHEAVAN